MSKIKQGIEIKQQLPKYVLDTAAALRDGGYEAYLVGGSVRDILLGKEPKDYDIATNAYPEQVQELFPKSVPTGAKFGTILVLMPDEEGENFEIEVTTYRSEADYFGGRWPAKVEFTKTIDEDLARRDFTINAIALRIDNDILEEVDIVDPFGGVADLQAKTIRAVGDPEERFSEDGLRSIRGCRLAANLDFDIEEKTFAAISKTLDVTRHVSTERVRDELIKLLMKSSKPSKGLELMRKSGLLEIFIPELLEGIDINQPQFHEDDVYTHTLKAVDEADDEVKIAALFHDIAKPRTRSEDEAGVHFYGHDKMGEEMTREIMTRLRFPKREVERTATLVRWHMFYYPNADWRKAQNEGKEKDPAHLGDEQLEVARQEAERAQLGKSRHKKTLAGGWSDAAVRRFIRNVGSQELIDDLMKLRIADAAANPKSPFNPLEIKVLGERIAKVRQEDMALKVTDLDISGHDLIEMGITGKAIGSTLEHLLDKVTEDPELNSREELKELAMQYNNNQPQA
ncbi:MAG: CCA tRNA nucleotidyltransferase [Candidatus Dojkabacteria bacterium]